jgi:hypothetical protein
LQSGAGITAQLRRDKSIEARSRGALRHNEFDCCRSGHFFLRQHQLPAN